MIRRREKPGKGLIRTAEFAADDSNGTPELFEERVDYRTHAPRENYAKRQESIRKRRDALKWDLENRRASRRNSQ